MWPGKGACGDFHKEWAVEGTQAHRAACPSLCYLRQGRPLPPAPQTRRGQRLIRTSALPASLEKQHFKNFNTAVTWAMVT